MLIVVDLAVSFSQYFTGMINVPNVTLPDELRGPIDAVQSISIGQDLLTSWFPFMSDLRIYFTVLSICCPLLLIFLGLFSLVEKRILLLYIAGIAGVMLVVVGVVGSILAEVTSIPLSAEDTQLLLYIGIGIVVVTAIVVFVATRFSEHDRTTKAGDKTNEQSFEQTTFNGTSRNVALVSPLSPQTKAKAERKKTASIIVNPEQPLFPPTGGQDPAGEQVPAATVEAHESSVPLPQEEVDDSSPMPRTQQQQEEQVDSSEVDSGSASLNTATGPHALIGDVRQSAQTTTITVPPTQQQDEPDDDRNKDLPLFSPIDTTNGATTTTTTAGEASSPMASTAVAVLAASKLQKSQMDQDIEEQSKHIDCFSTLQALFLWVLFGAVGVLCFDIYTFEIPEFKRWLDENADGLVWIIGIIAFAFAAFFLVWFVLCLFTAGRQFQNTCHRWVKTKLVKILLLMFSLVYIPIVTGIFYMYNCNEFSCPAGYRLPDFGSVVVSNQTTHADFDFCVPCQVAPSQSCPSDFAASLCQEERSERLEHAISIVCEDVKLFFWPAAGFGIVMFALGVPIMFFYLIEVTSEILHSKFPTSLDSENNKYKQLNRTSSTNPLVTSPSNTVTSANATIGEFNSSSNASVTNLATQEEEEEYKNKVDQSTNVANFLYEPFVYRCRMARLFQLVQKLCIVATTSFIIRSSTLDTPPQTFALVCSVVIHGLATVLLLVWRPFVKVRETILAVVLSALLTASSLLTLLVSQGYDLPLPLMYAVIVACAAVPVLAIVIAVIVEVNLWCSKSNKEQEELEERAKALEKAAHDEIDNLPDDQPADDITSQSGSPTRPAVPIPPPLDSSALHPSAVPSTPIKASSTNNNATPLHQVVRSQSMSFSVTQGRSAILSPAERERLKKEAKLKSKIRALEIHEEEQQQLKSLQKDVDEEINKVTTDALIRFLMIGGVFGVIALSCCALGLLVNDQEESTVGSPFPQTSTTATQLATYSSWDQFTSHCCCTSNQNAVNTSTYQVVEKWLCTNGRVKERVRVMMDGEDGLSVRSLCAVSFEPGCEVTVTNTSSGNVVSFACSGDPTTTLW